MNVYVCVRTCIHLHLRKFGDLRMCICICICIRVSTHLYDNVRLCTFIYAYLRVSTHLYVYLRICMCIYACEHISTHVPVYQFSSIGDAYALHLACSVKFRIHILHTVVPNEAYSLYLSFLSNSSIFDITRRIA